MKTKSLRNLYSSQDSARFNSKVIDIFDEVAKECLVKILERQECFDNPNKAATWACEYAAEFIKERRNYVEC